MENYDCLVYKEIDKSGLVVKEILPEKEQRLKFYTRQYGIKREEHIS